MSKILLEQPSVQSLALEMFVGSQSLGTATGFVVKSSTGKRFLVTNWHVLTGRHLHTGQPLHPSAATPDRIAIAHNTGGTLGAWTVKSEPLYDNDGTPLWVEHPKLGPLVDVVALPLADLDGVDTYEHSFSGPVGHDVQSLPSALKWGVSDFVNIIGFPFGWTGGGMLGIWVQGAIATEPQLDFQGLPCFLIDSRTRQGQSGSPVVIYKRNGWVTLEDGRPYMIHNPVTMMIGVYSGRLSSDSDLGTVWKVSVVADLLAGR
jgi:hypothetical protein